VERSAVSFLGSHADSKAHEVRLSNRLRANGAAERDDVAPYVSKSVPQRLKPSFEGHLRHG
jgi:hypothetical protein